MLLADAEGKSLFLTVKKETAGHRCAGFPVVKPDGFHGKRHLWNNDE